jgi:hypothetical protein
VAPALQETLDQTRRASERYLMVRCIEGLAEIALLAGDTRRCRACADELLEIAGSNGLHELEASARRWRGEALLAERDFAQAEMELSRAAAQALHIGRVRLQMDAAGALARLYEAQRQCDAAEQHAATASRIAGEIKKSLASSGLETP